MRHNVLPRYDIYCCFDNAFNEPFMSSICCNWPMIHESLYCDNNVINFWSTSEMVSVGKVHSNSAFLARQSKLLTWSDKIAPATGNPAGRRTSNG